MKLTENFRRAEFDCRDGTKVPDNLIPNLLQLAFNLQVLRDEIKMPIYVNSGYRTEGYNELVSGAKKSQHLEAKAADIRTDTIKPEVLKSIIEQLIHTGKMKQGGLAAYATFVHYDIRGKKARW